VEKNVRVYGDPPYPVAVLHGGPGAPGYMAPVARELSESVGVIEPLQTENSLEGQISELSGQLRTYTDSPITLIGSSWGAVLALFLAARNPEQVAKLVLVGCAVFDAASSASITPRRRARLTPQQQQRHDELTRLMSEDSVDNRDTLMAEWGKLLSASDMYDPVTRDLEVIEVQYDLHTGVWNDFVALRDRPGQLQREFRSIEAPVTLMHGEYDPHPITGIQPFLEDCLGPLECHLLPECGHYPWIERQARSAFFEILRNIL
jgi:pimeloyl-ACP methyl ester carboxylesterase